jgi:hypothetical protein
MITPGVGDCSITKGQHRKAVHQVAKDYAAKALRFSGLTHSGLRYHPKVGLVEAPYESLKATLRWGCRATGVTRPRHSLRIGRPGSVSECGASLQWPSEGIRFIGQGECCEGCGGEHQHERPIWPLAMAPTAGRARQRSQMPLAPDVPAWPARPPGPVLRFCR